MERRQGMGMRVGGGCGLCLDVFGVMNVNDQRAELTATTECAMLLVTLHVSLSLSLCLCFCLTNSSLPRFCPINK